MARILVVDDDEVILNWLLILLRGGGHEARGVGSGEAMFEALRSEVPELLLVDLLLPGVNGMEILQRLRAEAATAGLPVILITSLDPKRYLRMGMELGADDFLVKPLAGPEVLTAVRTRLERQEQARRGRTVGGLPVNIGSYTLERLLARGTTSEVHYARRTGDRGSDAAMKIFRTRRQADARQVGRFLREVEIASAVQHPNLATVYESGAAESLIYVAFEFFPRGDLAGFIGEGLAPSLVRRVVSHVAMGLGALHEAGIVHRDIKPANIMIRSTSDFVIADFGLAKLVQQNISLTATGEVLGTPAYLAPEQAMSGPVGPWTDIYNLGVVTFELLTGATPFDGANHQAIVFKHIHNAPPQLPQKAAMFQPVIDRMLAKEPGERYADTRQLLAALDALQVG
jgi:serine/threonine protein kinase